MCANAFWTEFFPLSEKQFTAHDHIDFAQSTQL